MNKYIAFLRGINVGNIRIKMLDLKLAFEQLGFTDVKTILQTGNVVFMADEDASSIKSMLEKALTATFHYDAFVQIYEFTALEKIIEGYPMQRIETHHAYVVFVENESIFEELKLQVQNIGMEAAEIRFGKQVIYWRVPKGESTETSFAKILNKARYKSHTTTRNINTLEKMS